MPEPLQQVNVSLPVALVAFIQRRAAQTDRTMGGMIRHLVAEWARREAAPEGPFPKPRGE
jgi:hypothetical protein